jgi:hypothetical protein
MEGGTQVQVWSVGEGGEEPVSAATIELGVESQVQ